MSIDMKKDYRTQLSQKNMEEKSLGRTSLFTDMLLKMAHFVATIERTLAEELASLFRDNV